MTGAERIAAERERQRLVHNYDERHDDKHSQGGSLAAAAACYAASGAGYSKSALNIWPWRAEWDKRPDKGAPREARIRALEKAGALCAAEIDRLLRGGS